MLESTPSRIVWPLPIFFFLCHFLAICPCPGTANCCLPFSGPGKCQLAALISPLSAPVTEPRKSGRESSRKGSPLRRLAIYSYETRMGKRDTTGPNSYLAPAKTSPVPGVESAMGLSKLTSTSNSENAKALCAATDRKVHHATRRPSKLGRALQMFWLLTCFVFR